MSTNYKEGYSYTRVMQDSLQEWNSKLQSFYCRNDFSRVLDRLDRAKEDNRLFVRRELKNMCDARDLDAEALIANRSLLESVPTREDVLNELLELFHDNYQNCYSSEDFMTRIVRRLAPEYQEDPVRLAILKKFIIGAGNRWQEGKQVDRKYKTGAIHQWSLAHFSSDERQALAQLSEKEQIKRIAENLDDSIFSQEYMNIELDETEQFLLMSERLSKWIGNRVITTNKEAANNPALADEALMDDMPLKEETEEALQTFCIENGLPIGELGNHVAMLSSITGALKQGSLSEDGKAFFRESLLPTLEEEFKQFLKTTYYKKSDGTYQELAKLFKTDQRDARNKKASDWELLKLCDDYANGKFRTNGGKTRVYLYYFAMMFDMSLGSQVSDTQDSKPDLERDLFEDYYNDNVLRYLQQEYATSRASAKYENEPVGEGINYKNYAEVIYLYYLCRKDLKLDPGERIDRAEKLITECRTAALEKNIPTPWMQESAQNKGKYTDYYRETHFGHIINLPEEQLLDYILENYRVLAKNEEGMSRVMVSAEQETAYDTVEFIMDVIDESYAPSVFARQLLQEDCEEEDSPTSQEEMTYNSGGYFCGDLAEELRKKYDGETEFLLIVDNLDRRLSNPKKNISPEEKRVSRGTFLSLCLSDYIFQLFEYEEGFKDTIVSFPGLYLDFVEDVNTMLIDARFQPFKGTNLMDLYILISLYFYMVQNWGSADV